MADKTEPEHLLDNIFKDKDITDKKIISLSEMQTKLWTVAKTIVERQKKCFKKDPKDFEYIQWDVLESEWQEFIYNKLFENDN